jgi:hypothetical protein
MYLKRKQIMPAVLTHCWKRVLFTNGTQVSLKNFSDETSPLVLSTSKEKTENTLNTVFSHVKKLAPVCSHCDDNEATAVMPDGYLVCIRCRPTVEAYYQCEFCQKQLNAAQGGYARRKVERITCGEKECTKREAVKFGNLCCMEAEYIPCVCRNSFKCPVHCPEGVHYGTHD